MFHCLFIAAKCAANMLTASYFNIMGYVGIGLLIGYVLFELFGTLYEIGVAIH